jgi:hypothetical protein
MMSVDSFPTNDSGGTAGGKPLATTVKTEMQYQWGYSSMRSHPDFGMGERLLRKMALAVLLAAAGMSAAQGGDAAANVVVWDTGSPFGDTVDLGDRSGWKAVPADLIALEADPAKASSDPGYYGREYSFRGDAVVENQHFTTVLWSAKARAVVYSKADPSRPPTALTPLQLKTEPGRISHCAILRNAGDEVTLEVSFFDKRAEEDLSAVLSFDKTPVIEVKPAENMKGISLLSPIAYGIVPGFIGDDLIFAPGRYPSVDTLCVPSENLFLGLLKRENSELVITWPKGKQQMRLGLGGKEQEARLIESIDFDNDGQSVYLALLEAPGIWHREELKPSYLERDAAIDWKRPFPAKWITQLNEAGVRTSFAFRESKGQIWRGVAGMYIYPVWFNGDDAFYHLSKKIPPKGESLIYFLEGKGTPISIWTPVDIVKATLGRQMCDTLLDAAGRKLRTHHRRGAEGIRRACTCGCTEAMQAVFEVGKEVEKREYIEGAVDDMAYFVRRHMERIDEYRAFADDTIKFLRLTAGSAAELKPFLDSLEQIVQQIPQEYEVQKENIKSLEYADELARKTKALTLKKAPENLPTYLDLGEKWRAMGGAQDGLLAQCHMIARNLFQEAGYGCVSQPGAVEPAQEIRRRCRQCLRNPDGYEIWPNY